MGITDIVSGIVIASGSADAINVMLGTGDTPIRVSSSTPRQDVTPIVGSMLDDRLTLEAKKTTLVLAGEQGVTGWCTGAGGPTSPPEITCVYDVCTLISSSTGVSVSRGTLATLGMEFVGIGPTASNGDYCSTTGLTGDLFQHEFSISGKVLTRYYFTETGMSAISRFSELLSL